MSGEVMVFGRKRGLVAMALPTPVHFSLDVSEGFDRVLEDLAEKTGRSRSEVLVKAVALMAIAVEAKEQGKKDWLRRKGRIPPHRNYRNLTRPLAVALPRQ